jgi:hypothetical protein
LKFATLLAAALVAAVLTTTAALGAAGTKTTASLPEIDVTMNGSSIVVGGTLESGAVTVHSVASGKHSGSPLLVRLNDGVTANDFVAWLGTPAANDPNNVVDFGSIDFSVEGGPGTNDVQTILRPGVYVAFDASKNDPTSWPNTAFTIADNPSPMTLPAVKQSQKAIEFGFKGPATLHTGQLIRTSNAGFLVHMMVGVSVKNKAAGLEAVKLLRAGKDKAVNKLIQGFYAWFGPVSHGAVQQFTLTQKPGWYVEACFMDTQDGREHTRLGMERLIHIVK